MSQIYFVSGIDTEIGKTYATGYIAKQFLAQGLRCITQKLLQTGCVNHAEDIHTHRKIMGIDLQPEDVSKLSMPEIFSYPASPHLAARLAGREINWQNIQASTTELAKRYDVLLIEGAGGLMVPLTEQLLLVDYIEQQGYPVILVTSGRLGSINHTLLSLALLQQRGIPLFALAFNHAHDHRDAIIAEDTARYLRAVVARDFPDALWVDVPVMALSGESD